MLCERAEAQADGRGESTLYDSPSSFRQNSPTDFHRNYGRCSTLLCFEKRERVSANMHQYERRLAQFMFDPGRPAGADWRGSLTCSTWTRPRLSLHAFWDLRRVSAA